MHGMYSVMGTRRTAREWCGVRAVEGSASFQVWCAGRGRKRFLSGGRGGEGSASFHAWCSLLQEAASVSRVGLRQLCPCWGGGAGRGCGGGGGLRPGRLDG